MPRKAKAARLLLRNRPGREPVYVILDGGRELSTGTSDLREAEARLAAYISERDRRAGPSAAAELLIADALALYAEDKGEAMRDPVRLANAIDALVPFWGHLPVSAVKAETCRAYMKHRAKADGTMRRELGVLQAAVNHCRREGYLLEAPQVTLAPKSLPRDRWLTRSEAAALLRAARRLRVDGRHLARFILVGLYTGTRKSAILNLRLDVPHTSGGWVDLERGVMHRRSGVAAESRKRTPTVRVPRKLLGHLRRWRRLGARWAVEDYAGRRVGDVKKGWSRAREIAGLGPDVVPHVLRHTAITWAMQAGADKWHVAGFFGVSVEVLESTYGHHHPDHQESAVRAMDRR